MKLMIALALTALTCGCTAGQFTTQGSYWGAQDRAMNELYLQQKYSKNLKM